MIPYYSYSFKRCWSTSGHLCHPIHARRVSLPDAFSLDRSVFSLPHLLNGLRGPWHVDHWCTRDHIFWCFPLPLDASLMRLVAVGVVVPYLVVGLPWSGYVRYVPWVCCRGGALLLVFGCSASTTLDVLSVDGEEVAVEAGSRSAWPIVMVLSLSGLVFLGSAYAGFSISWDITVGERASELIFRVFLCRIWFALC